MADAIYAERIAAPAEKVWPFLDWSSLEMMLPGGFMTRVEYDERRAVVGATRRVWFADGQSVRERLEALPEHPADYAYDYRIIDTGDLPIAEYRGSVRLTPAGEDTCNLRFSAEFTPLGITADEWRAVYVDMQKQQIAFIRDRVER